MKEAIITDNIGLVGFILSKVYTGDVSPCVSREDLFQAGCEGLIRAVKTWDKEKGALSTYAYFWIRRYILAEIGNHARVIRAPIVWQFSKDAPEEIYNAVKKTKSVASLEEINEIQENLLSLEESDDGAYARLSEKITYIDSCKAYQEPVEVIAERKELLKTVQSAFDCLTEREQYILRARFGFDGQEPKTLVKTGKELRLSKDRIHQLEVKSLRKLKRLQKIRELGDFS